jgi:hypothetical protein
MTLGEPAAFPNLYDLGFPAADCRHHLLSLVVLLRKKRQKKATKSHHPF